MYQVIVKDFEKLKMGKKKLQKFLSEKCSCSIEDIMDVSAVETEYSTIYVVTVRG